jgi:hypothetical protein
MPDSAGPSPLGTPGSKSWKRRQRKLRWKGVRPFATLQFETKPATEALRAKLEEKGEEQYSLSGRRWHNMCGAQTLRTQELRDRRRKCEDATGGGEPVSRGQVYHKMSATPKKTPKLEEFCEHVRSYSRYLPSMWEAALRTATLRRRFYARQQKQRALYTALRELCGGRPPSKCVLLWGNGSFRPSVFRGHPSAPNKALYEFFARFMAVIIVDERGTSKYSPCCDKKVRRPCHSGDRKGRVHGMGYCTGCGQRWSRDAGAAVKMRDRFLKKCGVSLTCPLNAPSGA